MRWSGRCAECETEFEAGDPVYYDDGKTYCEECGPEAGEDPAAAADHDEADLGEAYLKKMQGK